MSKVTKSNSGFQVFFNRLLPNKEFFVGKEWPSSPTTLHYGDINFTSNSIFKTIGRTTFLKISSNLTQISNS